MDLKDISLIVWACARIRVPADSPVPNLLENHATNLLKNCVTNQFLFEWTQ